MKYKVGDKVRIRKDLEVGVYYGGCLFAPKMQNLCGEIAYITGFYKHCGAYHIDSSTEYWTDEMFEEDKEKMNDNDSIRILVNGNKVVAIHMETGKKGVARCHPDDKFDFYTGAKLALERLEEAENPYTWLKERVEYYIPDVTDNDLYEIYSYEGDGWDRMYMERGIVFKTKEEAIECAKKMLAVVTREG